MVLATATISGTILRPDDSSVLAVEVAVEAVAPSGFLKETATGNMMGGTVRATSDLSGNLTITLPQLPQAGVEPSNAHWRATFRVVNPTNPEECGNLPVDRPPPTTEFELSGNTTWGALMGVW